MASPGSAACSPPASENRARLLASVPPLVKTTRSPPAPSVRTPRMRPISSRTRLQRLPLPAAGLVLAGRIAEAFRQPRLHGRDDFGQQRRRGVVVEVD